MIAPYKPIGTIARMWADSTRAGFTDSLVDLCNYSHAVLCRPGEHIAYKRATVSWHESARNELAAEFEGDWLLMLDTDHIFAPDLLERMLRLCRTEGLQFLSGIYQYKFPPHHPVAGVVGESGQIQQLLDWNPNKPIIDVSVVGGGCMLIYREVFDRIRKELRQEPFTIIPGLSEDYSFCMRLQKLGIRVPLAVNIECHHVIPTVLSIRDYKPGLWKAPDKLVSSPHDTPRLPSPTTSVDGVLLQPAGGEVTPVEEVRGSDELLGSRPACRPGAG